MVVIQRLAQKTGIGLQLDPILFKTFGVLYVPAVVHVKDTPACPANRSCKPVEFDRLYGDVMLDYALEKLGEEDSENQILNDMLHRLRGDIA